MRSLRAQMQKGGNSKSRGIGERHEQPSQTRSVANCAQTVRRSVHNADSPGLRITSPSSKFARRERISHTENDTYHVIPAAGGKSLKRKSLKNNEINC